MRTRGNGEPLTVRGIIEDAANVRSTTDRWELEHDLRSFVAERSREAFDTGMQLSSRVENGVAVQAIVTSLLQVLGKDRGDGIIDLGAAGRWYPGTDGGSATKEGN